MANTYEKIQTVLVGSGGSSTVEFTSIPQTYNDLLLKISSRNDDSNVAGNMLVIFNSSSSTFSNSYLQASGSGTGNGNVARMIGDMDTAAEQSGIFNNIDVYIPNYSSSSYPKTFFAEATTESVNTDAYKMLTSNRWDTNSAITSITIENRTSGKVFVQHTRMVLYGIKNS
jgi:hypothetical protein